MAEHQISWLGALLFAFITACTWIGFLSIVDMITDIIREAYKWLKNSKSN